MPSRFAITTVDVDLPTIGSQTLKFSRGSSHQSQTTVLVGRNGTGKSSVLRELAMSFRAYFSKRDLKSRQGMGRVSHIGISSDDANAMLNVTADAKAFRSERDSLRTLGPAKVIALSFTPFDKFPPADDTRESGYSGGENPFYVYLGFKAEYRISPRARLLRSIDQLTFAERTAQGDHRVVQTRRDRLSALVTISYEPAQGSSRDRPSPSGVPYLQTIF